MKQARELKSFIYGQHFSDGLRITLGCMIPVAICAIIGLFYVGTLISLGALLLGIADTPGPASHRRTGMLACLIICVFSFFATILASTSFPLMCVVLAIISFTYAMFGVFNTRAANIGTMGILMMLLNVDSMYSLTEELQFILLFLLGAVWYIIVSLSLTKMRPYRQAQQELAESIRHVADYLRIKSDFYSVDTDYDTNYLKIVEKQVLVHQHQENVREILFKSKRSIKDTTKIGRFLTLVFNDIVDLFEQGMSTFYDYSAIRNTFIETGVLHHFKFVLVKLSHELDHFAYELTANRMPKQLYTFSKDIELLKVEIDALEAKHPDLNTLPLKKIIVNIRRIASLITNMYGYSKINKADIKKQEIDESKKFVQTSHIDWKVFKNNLSLDSSVFRHALRVSIVLTATFILVTLAGFTEQGSFWVLLTILVILKPGFGVTKSRNFQRLVGTIVGGVMGTVILITVENQFVLFGFLMIFFLIAYSLFRVNYIMSVFFMTPYVLILISFTGVSTLEMVQERILDTFLGCFIAFLSSYLIFPNWEGAKLKSNVYKLLSANYLYLEQIAKVFTQSPIDVTEYKLMRKELYIASANMGSTLQRLFTEPKWRQKNTKEVNRFVVLNHLFSSYAASIYSELDKSNIYVVSQEHMTLLRKTAQNLLRIITSLDPNEAPEDWTKNYQLPDDHPEPMDIDNQLITERLQFLLKIASDLQKSTQEVIQKDTVKHENQMQLTNG